MASVSRSLRLKHAIKQSARSVASVKSVPGYFTDLDNHANQCVVSENNALITNDFNVPVTVQGYSKSTGTGQYNTVTGVVAYNQLKDGRTYYLHIHQALNIPDMKTNLLCPNQLRAIGIRVNDEPKHLVPEPTPNHHAITINEPHIEEELIIALRIRGVTPFFHTRKPTQEEYDDSNPAYYIDLTAQEIPWEPDDDDFGDSEGKMLDHNDEIIERDPLSAGRSTMRLFKGIVG